MTTPRRVTPALLRAIPLPAPNEAGDKNDRGRVLVVGGSIRIPGALVLAGTGALRAGAGKLQLATCAAVAPLVALAVPEALVAGVAQTKSGEIAAAAARAVAGLANATDALLIGPGMGDGRAAVAFLSRLLRSVERDAARTVVLDAGAIAAVRRTRGAVRRFGGRVVLTPHAGEMAALLGADAREVAHDPAGSARRAAAEWNAVVALKGAETYIATPGGALYRYAGGTVGLATSGSGDTLAGIIAGLAARGATPAHAAVWGAYLHGAAGVALARRRGTLGFLARELLDEIPPIMNRLAPRRRPATRAS